MVLLYFFLSQWYKMVYKLALVFYIIEKSLKSFNATLGSYRKPLNFYKFIKRFIQTTNKFCSLLLKQKSKLVLVRPDISWIIMLSRVLATNFLKYSMKTKIQNNFQSKALCKKYICDETKSGICCRTKFVTH